MQGENVPAPALRHIVFVVEQDCPYPELDGKDQRCQHLLGWRDDQPAGAPAAGHQAIGHLAAYCRWYDDGSEAVLGRIVTSPQDRAGLGMVKIVIIILNIIAVGIHISAFFVGK